MSATMVMSVVQRARVGWVEVLTSVPNAVAEEFLTVYRGAFAPLETLSPARQAMTDEEFLEAMEHQSVTKFLGRDTAGSPCAMGVMATDLDIVPWISVPYFAARFPEHHRRGAIYYFHALLVRPELQGGPWARLILEELTRTLAAKTAVAAFDCCGYTVDVSKLPDVIARVAGRLSYLEPLELDRQHYYGYVMDGLR